jgi:glycosyltransferase involved in cell wall biosynthesis
VLFVANTDWYLYNFRLNLLRAARDEGWSVPFAAPRHGFFDRLLDLGFDGHAVGFDAPGINPLKELRALGRLAWVFRKTQPAVVHLFTLKCVLYGCLCAPFARRTRIIGAVTGMGHLFTTRSWQTRLLKIPVLGALRFALRLSGATLIFQNDADRQEFVDQGLISAGRTRVIRGSGVDCQAFRPSERPRDPGTPLRLLFCGRLITEKGIHEYLEATRQLRSRGHRFSSRIAGAPYPGNPSSLTPPEVDALAAEDDHEYLGHHGDMKRLLADSDIVVLPTYREGTPKALLEAAACGCIIVTTDIPGCQGVVDPGENGDLVPVRDVGALVRSIEQILALSDSETAAMKTRSRAIAVERFSDTRVNAETLALYTDACPSKCRQA